MALKSVFIAIPTFESIEPDCFKSIYGQRQMTDKYYIMFDFVRGYDCARARNMIVKEALDYNFDYVLMVDSDTTLPKNAVDELFDALNANPDAIAMTGWLLRKGTKTGQTAIFRLSDTKNYDDTCNINRDELSKLTEPFEVKGCGGACIMIRCDMLRKMYEKDNILFKYVTYPDGSSLSEDLYFSSMARANGYKIMCHPHVRCGHICKIVI